MAAAKTRLSDFRRYLFLDFQQNGWYWRQGENGCGVAMVRREVDERRAKKGG